MKVLVELDTAERNRIVNALKALARSQENAARGRPLAGPRFKDTRAVVREDARDCRALADKIRKLAGTENGND